MTLNSLRAGLQVLFLGGILLFPQCALAQSSVVPENKINELTHTLDEFGEASESGNLAKTQKELDKLSKIYESIEKNVEITYPEINEDIEKSIDSLKSSVRKKDIQSDEFREDFEELEANIIQLVPDNNTEGSFEKKVLILNETLDKAKIGLDNEDWGAVNQEIDFFSEGYEAIETEATTRSEESNEIIESKLHEIKIYLSQNQPDVEKIGEYILDIQTQLVILAGKTQTRGSVAGVIDSAIILVRKDFKALVVLGALIVVLGALLVTRIRNE